MSSLRLIVEVDEWDSPKNALCAGLISIPRLVIMPHLKDEDIKKLTELPEVNFAMMNIVADRVVREFTTDKYDEEFKKLYLSDIEELFKRMPEAEEKAFEIVTERVLKEIRK